LNVEACRSVAVLFMRRLSTLSELGRNRPVLTEFSALWVADLYSCSWSVMTIIIIYKRSLAHFSHIQGVILTSSDGFLVFKLYFLISLPRYLVTDYAGYPPDNYLAYIMRCSISHRFISHCVFVSRCHGSIGSVSIRRQWSCLK